MASLTTLSDWLCAHPLLASALEHASRAEAPYAVSGVGPAAKAFFAAAVAKRSPSGLYVARNTDEAKRVTAELESYGVAAQHFPAIDVSPYERLSPEPEMLAQRQAALAALATGTPTWLVTAPKALAARLPLPEAWRANLLALEVGLDLPPQRLIETLVRLGYRPTPQVTERGEFARRGGVLDVFPPNAEWPLRLEYFGDEIEALRTFDPETQRSEGAVPSAVVFPVRELVLPEDGWDAIAKSIRAAFVRHQKKLGFVANRLQAQTEADIEKLAAFGSFEGAGRYAPFVHERMGTLLDHLPAGAPVVFDDLEQQGKERERWLAAQLEAYAASLAKGDALPLPYPLHVEPAELAKALAKRPTLDLTARTDGELTLALPDAQRFHGELDQIAVRIGQARQAGTRVLLVSQQPQRAAAILEERGQSVTIGDLPPKAEGAGGGAWVTRDALTAGFEAPFLDLAVFTDLELFGQHRRATQKAYKKFSYQGQAIGSVAELKPGDYVVHQKHGVGQYKGLTKLEVDGQAREYLLVTYHNDDRLYVPADQVNTLHRYRAEGGGAAPKRHKMGGVEWENAKKKVKKGLKDLADDLIKLYGERAATTGYAYPPDTPWQTEMEEAFPYEETPDQLRAIEEVKRDLERDRPMDRLVCGDVGFGKTEVAIRAAFKAIMAGKQVAILAPTTVLAQQHYLVFKERFAPYPVRVGALSRFRTPKEQREVVSKLKTGEIDLVVGTHRVLSKDLGFKDLGLVVIDEEHRFGVANKERLKYLKKSVDVLTMSATPIPRTLYMALSGARDLSLISTPPMNRQPVRTHVGPFHPDTARAAILHELERGGQAFVLHNRVETIRQLQARIEALVPEARVRVAHGQLSEHELEDIMLAFKEHEFDVLLCTTIIESGLDIPRANTMIIDHADMLGLAQLYQLRGRVGRSEIKAYCYCFYDPKKQLTEDARDRLLALQQFTALGSGYQIALRDLEIRGVGNLLGAEQHGHMVTVGFDYYTQMLEEAIAEAQSGQAVEAPPEPTTVDLHVSAFLPEEYLGEGGDKMALYKRLAAVTSLKELQLLEAEWRDRFGPAPAPVRHLYAIVRLKLMATELGLSAIRSDLKLIKVQGAVPGSAFYKAQAKAPALRPWTWTPTELTINRERMRPEDQIAACDALLGALAETMLTPA